MANYINSHFASTKNTLGNRIQRSRIVPRPFNIRTTFNPARLVPLYWFETVPGGIYKADMSGVIRGSTPKTNPLDDAFADIVAFYVPYRILWNHWEQFNGEPEVSAWTQTASYSIPKLSSTSTDTLTVAQQSLLNYLGLPIGTYTAAAYVSDLPIRAYYEIWNWYYRDENTQNVILYSKGDTAAYSGADPTHLSGDVFTNGGSSNYLAELGRGQIDTTTASCVMPVNRFHDYFSSALPQPFKEFDSAPVVPIDGTAPVYAGSTYIFGTDYNVTTPLQLRNASTGAVIGGTRSLNVAANSSVYVGDDGSGDSGSTSVTPSNLMTNLSIGDTSFSLLDFRKAVVMLHVYEQLARGGSRYDEMLKGIWDVEIKDSHIQRPQFLGGVRQPLSFFSVMNTAGSADGTDASSLGTVGAYSVSTLNDALFRQATNEFGLIMILGCVRNSESYSQGIERKWTRSEFFDLPLPEMASVGDQAIYDYELFVNSSTDFSAPTVFGYTERFGELKEFYSRNVGYMDPALQTGIGTNWSYGNSFSSKPSLASFIPAEASNIGRVMQVSPDTSGFTFFSDFQVRLDMILPYGVHDQPGLTRI